MIVSTKGRYALRVMIDLSEHQSEKYVPLKEIAARQEISEKYLENIIKEQVQKGILEGLRLSLINLSETASIGMNTYAVFCLKTNRHRT